MQTSPTTYDPSAVYKYKDVYKVERDGSWDVIVVSKRLIHMPMHTCSTEAQADEWITIEQEKQDK